MEKVSLAAQTVFRVGNFQVTNTMIATWLAIVVLTIIGLVLKNNIASVPKGLQNIFEYLIEWLLGLCDGITGSREKTKAFFPWVATFFLFILFANWMGLLPGFSAFGIEKDNGNEFIPILRAANTDLNTTIALAIVSLGISQYFGVRFAGFKNYANKFLNFSGPIQFFTGVLEIISEISKIISFSFRLFGNIFAGEILLLVISFLVPYIVPIPFYGLEIFVGFIQALVFATLTLVFMTVATITHDEHQIKKSI